MLLHTAYKPTSLDDITHHTELVQVLKKYKSSTIPHIILHGISGAAKQTILGALLNTNDAKLKTITVKTTKEIQVTFLETKNTIQITPSDYNNQDKTVIQYLIKELAQTRSLTQNFVNMQQEGFYDSNAKFIVINESDKLTRDAQAALRRTVERYSNNFRLVLVCEEIDAIMEALRSRCMCVRVRGFTDQEISNVISVKNDEIVKRAKGNLRKALCLVEMQTTKNKTLDLEYEIALNDIVNQATAKQDGNTVLSIRKELYNLLNSCIPARIIVKELAKRFSSKVKNAHDKCMVYESALKYEERMLQGNKDIVHLEGFVVEMMCIFYNK